MIVASKKVSDTPILAKVVRAGDKWAAFVELPDGSSFGKVRLIKSKQEAIRKARADLASLDEMLGV